MTVQILLYVLAPICAYLIAGINPAILLSRAIYHEDIREKGSGNPGFTNFKRVFGSRFAYVVFALDLLKSILPCFLFGILFSHYLGMYQVGVAYTGVFALLGHAYPIWYRFRGGKAFLVGAGAIFLMDWRAGLIATVVMIVFLFTLQYMSLASIMAALSCPISLAILGVEHPAVLACCIFSSAFIIYRHKANINRLFHHTESKFRLFGSKKSDTEKI